MISRRLVVVPLSHLALQVVHSAHTPIWQSTGGAAVFWQPGVVAGLLHGATSVLLPLHHLPEPSPCLSISRLRCFTPSQGHEQSLQ